MIFPTAFTRVPRTARLGLTGLVIALGAPLASAQSDREFRCMQLEQELANDWQFNSGAEELPRIQAEIRRMDQVYQQSERRAERAGCYENFFIFGRGLVRTPRCLRMHDQIEDARRQLARLQQRRNAIGSGGNRRRDRIMQALARNGCGSQYQQQARREPRGFLEELFGGFNPFPDSRRDGWTATSIDSGRPYRTLCVRTCDGFYYPISYSVMPSAFAGQRAQCQSQCAAPADLYVYPNPGGQVEQAVSLDGVAYMDLKNAFKYRKEYVKGCSCKAAEYNPAEIEAAGQEKKADAGGEDPAADNQSAAAQPEPEADPETTASIAPARKQPASGTSKERGTHEAAASSIPKAQRPKAASAKPMNASVAQKSSNAPPRR